MSTKVQYPRRRYRYVRCTVRFAKSHPIDKRKRRTRLPNLPYTRDQWDAILLSWWGGSR